MEKVIGGILAILTFGAVAAMGLMRGLAAEAILSRALLCGLAGGVIGWLSVGPLGKSLIQASVRITEEPPPESGTGQSTEKP